MKLSIAAAIFFSEARNLSISSCISSWVPRLAKLWPDEAEVACTEDVAAFA
jgi:hypothetical protein